MVKKTRGRQRIPITRITHRSNLQVTFSKRRSGLFKKASEISTLCGADVALIVFSPAEKVFSYGNPCLDTVVDRFIEGTDNNSSAAPETMMMQLMQEERNNVQNMQLEHIQGLLENERRRGEELTRAMEANSHEWWRAPVEELSLEQLEVLRERLLYLKGNIQTQYERIMLDMANQQQPPPPPPPPVQYFDGPAGSTSYYGVGTSGGGGFDGFADYAAGPSDQPINVPQPYNVGYEYDHQQQQQQQGFY